MCTEQLYAFQKRGKKSYWTGDEPGNNKNIEACLKKERLSLNTISFFYMLFLRAVYNRAVEKELTTQRFPFRHVYTGIEKTIKRAIPQPIIRQIKIRTPGWKLGRHARDMFLFGFYTRGMSFVDMAYLKKILQQRHTDLSQKKAGQQLSIKWEQCMQEIMKNTLLTQQSNHYINRRRNAQYRNSLTLVNRKLKILSVFVRSPHPFAMHVMRHSWARFR